MAASAAVLSVVAQQPSSGHGPADCVVAAGFDSALSSESNLPEAAREPTPVPTARTATVWHLERENIFAPSCVGKLGTPQRIAESSGDPIPWVTDCPRRFVSVSVIDPVPAHKRKVGEGNVGTRTP